MSELSATTIELIKTMKELPFNINELYRHRRNKLLPIFSATINTFFGENNYGKTVKASLKEDLLFAVEHRSQFQGGKKDSDELLLTKKLFRFRPRLIGADDFIYEIPFC